MSRALLRIASRGSPLALAQAHLARAAIARAQGWPEPEWETLAPILTFRTTGDRIQDRPLAEAGGKGLFVKEIEDALLQDEADVAVHSMKDMPAQQPRGLALVAILPREDPHDVLITRNGGGFRALPKGARLGTASVRRSSQALRLRPDLQIVTLRGNVETRLTKLARGDADATLLARAGLERLDIPLPEGTEILDGASWLPALCQGAIGLEVRSDEARTRSLVEAADHAASHLAIACERGFLAGLDGSCRTPIAGLARLEDTRLLFHGEVLTPNGAKSWSAEHVVPIDGRGEEASEKARSVGARAAKDIRDQAGNDLPRFG
jgi:hydroxymethylbilane synthase